jgi:hypothetical protein
MPNLSAVLARGKRTESGCLEWQGALNSAGYPVMKVKGKAVLVTRWILSLRRRFKRKELACHSCDNASCIEPEHLEHGTYSKNLKDAWHRSRRYSPNTFLEDNNAA